MPSKKSDKPASSPFLDEKLKELVREELRLRDEKAPSPVVGKITPDASHTPVEAAEPYAGMQWPAHLAPPPGWDKLPAGHGTFELWPLRNRNFRMNIRQETLAALDQAYMACMPNPEYPNRPKILRLEVNAEFRRWFRNVHRWGNTDIATTADEKFAGRPADEPQFRFVVEKADDRTSTQVAEAAGLISDE